MQITYALTMEDYVALNHYHVKHTAAGRKSYRWFRYGGAAANFGMGFMVTGSGTLSLILMSSFALLWLILAPAVWRLSVDRRTRNMYREGRSGVGQPVTMNVDQEGIAMVWEDGESKVKWSGIDKMGITDQYIFLYVNAVNALIIPETAFVNNKERELFLQALSDYRTAACGLSV